MATTEVHCARENDAAPPIRASVATLTESVSPETAVRYFALAPKENLATQKKGHRISPMPTAGTLPVACGESRCVTAAERPWQRKRQQRSGRLAGSAPQHLRPRRRRAPQSCFG